jgi:hypothetical protein
MAQTQCNPSSDPGTAELPWARAGQDWQDVALQLRLLLSRGISLAIATVVGARGAVIRRPGTVLVVTEARQTVGSTRPGRWVDVDTGTGGRDRAEPQRSLRPGPGAHGSV